VSLLYWYLFRQYLKFTSEERAPRTHWIGSWVDLRASLDDLEKRKFLTLPGLELRPLGRPARSISKYGCHSKAVSKNTDSYFVTWIQNKMLSLVWPVMEFLLHRHTQIWISYFIHKLYHSWERLYSISRLLYKSETSCPLTIGQFLNTPSNTGCWKDLIWHNKYPFLTTSMLTFIPAG
jgi:hypothetical protein